MHRPSARLVAAWFVVLVLVTSSSARAAARTRAGGDGRAAVQLVAPRYGAGVRLIALEDTTRDTPADPKGQIPVVAAPTRALPTAVYYPTPFPPAPDTPPVALPEALPDAPSAEGRFPVILFSHGTPGTPDDYARILERWAREGYVVVAPTYPVSSRSGPDAAADRDQRDQVRDARFVLDEVLALDRRPRAAGGFEGLLDPKRIAAAGHSQGGFTTLALVSDCCRDRRIDAALVLAGVSETAGGPALRHPSGPILFAHASLDLAVPFAHSERAYRRAGTPKYLVEVRLPVGGMIGHILPFFAGSSEVSAGVARVLDDFLAGYVVGDGAARARVVPEARQGRYLRLRWHG